MLKEGATRAILTACQGVGGKVCKCGGCVGQMFCRPSLAAVGAMPNCAPATGKFISIIYKWLDEVTRAELGKK